MTDVVAAASLSDVDMRIALISEVFFGDPDAAHLTNVLHRARDGGADLAVLPELPLNEWAPYSKVSREEDAESIDGPRQQRMSEDAAASGVELVGGAIVRDEETCTRYNTAFVYDRVGVRRASYRKVHLPEEEGYWETSHYEPGDAAPQLIDSLPLRAGLQICSDVNRPQGFQLLAAQGAEVVFAPRATPPGSYDRWRIVLKANAVMSGTYVISVNRPRPEHGASIGGPSIAISPSGAVIAETQATVTIVDLSRNVVEQAGSAYPGYLARFPGLYSDAWSHLAE